MILDSFALRVALDRAIQRAVRRVTADDDRIDRFDRAMRLQDLIDDEVARFEQNLADNGEGIVRFDVDVIDRGRGRAPELYVSGGRMDRQR